MRVQSRFTKPELGFQIRNPKSAIRNGLTLAEVMISLMVLAIGLMGVLSLYPLGARQMATAVKDERAAQLAGIMEGNFRIYWRNACLRGDGSLRPDAEFFQNSPELQQLDVVNGSTAFNPGLATDPILRSSAPSQVLYLDPIGFGIGGSNQLFVGGVNNLLPRRTMSYLESNSGGLAIGMRLRFCSLMDDMSFNADGLASPVNRGYRYNAACVLQRAKNNVRQEVNLKVVVYQGRPPSDVQPVETDCGTVASLSPGSDTFTPPGGLPVLRSGAWILLVSQGDASLQPFADFYRVVNTVETSTNTTALTIEPPIRNRNRNGAAYSARLLLLDGVAEVFDRGTITPFEVPAS